MALYYYDKYTVHYYTIDKVSNSYYSSDWNSIGTDWIFDEKNGMFNLTGNIIEVEERYLVEHPNEYIGYYFTHAFKNLGVLTAGNYIENYARNANYLKKIHDSAGTFIERIVGEKNDYPDYGKKGDFYYIRRELAKIEPNLQFNIDNAIKKYGVGNVKINGQLKQIDNIWIKINNELREV